MNIRIFVLLLATLLLASCASWKSQDALDRRAGAGVQNEPVHVYYDFDDILVPRNLELIPEESLLFETPGVKAGLLVFEGRVEPVSLFDFFITNMPKDNWQLRSYFKYGRYIMVFEKADKDCVISLDEQALSTHLQIWVTPRYTGVMDSPGETILTQ